MAIKVTCESCNSVFNVNDALSGKKARCPKCQNILVIPSIEKTIGTLMQVENEKESSESSLGAVLRKGDKMTESEDKNNHTNKKLSEKASKRKGKGFLLFSLFMFLFMSSLVYGYYVFEKNPEDNFIVNNDFYKAYFYENSTLSNIFGLKGSKIDNKENFRKVVLRDDFNYSFDLKTNFEIKEDDIITSEGYLNIDNALLLSNEGGLKQQLTAEKVSTQYNFRDLSGQIVFDNTDIVTDNTKIYFLIGEGYKRLFNEKNIYNLLKNTKITKNTLLNIKDILSKEKYVEIDNGNTILNLFGEVFEQTIYKDIILGFATSNPKTYFLQNGINQKVRNILIRDQFLNYILKSTSKENKNLLINSEICINITHLIVNGGKEVLNIYGLEKDNISRMCKNNIRYINESLSYFDSISKLGNIKKGNFKIIFTKNDKKNIIINYKNHIIDSWNIDFNNGNIIINAKGDSDGVEFSKIKVDLVLGSLKFIWELEDGNGVIEIKDEKDKSKIIGKISLKAYNILDYKIGYELNSSDSSTIKISSEYKKGLFNIFYLYNKGETEGTKENININFTYNEGKINGEIKNNLLNSILSGDFKTINDFNILLLDEELGGELVVKGEKIEEGKKDYSLFLKIDGKSYLSGLINILKTKEDELDLLKVDGKIKFNPIIYSDLFGTGEVLPEGTKVNSEEGKSIEEDIQIKEIYENETVEKNNTYTNELKFIFDLESKKGEGVYKIPKDFKEIKIKASEIMIFPDLGFIKSFNINNIFLYGFMGIGSYIGIEGFKGYGKESDNKKIDSDIEKIISMIQEKIEEGVNLDSMVEILDEYDSSIVTIGGNKLSFGQNYFVGIPNSKVLGIEKDFFKDPKGNYYILGITTKNNGSFQLLSKIDKGDGTYIYKLSGTYIPSEFKILRKGKDYEIIENSKGEKKSIFLLKNTNLDLIKKGDKIGGRKVLQISNDKKTVTFNKIVKSSSILLKPDSKSLISIKGKIIKDGDVVE